MIDEVIQQNSLCTLRVINDELRNLLSWCGTSLEVSDKIIKATESANITITEDKLNSSIAKVNKFLSINSSSRDYTNVTPLLAQVSLATNTYKPDSYKLPFGKLNANAIHPLDKNHVIDKKQLGDEINIALNKIPSSHYGNLRLMVDHLDSLFTLIGHGVALVGHEHLSLCDLIKSKVALATALYAGDGENIVVIQGDFYGIQDYIFTEGRKANKGAAKLLRGRSFMVSLYTELVALKVLEACGMPATAQVMNAAGKFMIIGPKTNAIVKAIQEVKHTVNDWFWNNTYGVNGFGIAIKESNLDELESGERFTKFVKSLFAELEGEKAHKFADKLTSPVHNVDYSNGVCKYNNYLPAKIAEQDGNDDSGISILSHQQIKVGEYLVKYKRIIVASTTSQISPDTDTKFAVEDFLGYQVAFTKEKEITGFFGQDVRSEQILRFWDYSIAKEDGNLWNGFARRYINGYVAKVTSETITEQANSNKYSAIDTEDKVYQIETIKPWNYLACEDRMPDSSNQQTFIGQRALAVLKGDVDNLGAIFQQGISDNNFAKMLGLSRQINNFFAVYLPYLCKTKYPNVYTVFAGGDDFFLVGSWKTIMELASSMAEEFEKYVAHNPDLHFSSGIVLFNDGTPIKTLASNAEENLEHAKNSGKNAVNIFSVSCPWDEYESLLHKSYQIQDIKLNIGHGYVYGMLDLCNMAASEKPEDSIWHSYFIYRTHRLYGGSKDQSEDKLVEKLAILIGDNIKGFKDKFKITLMHYLYQQRT